MRFRKLTLGQQFIGIVQRIDKLKDDRRALSLELIDTSTPQDIKVHETLISEARAASAIKRKITTIYLFCLRLFV